LIPLKIDTRIWWKLQPPKLSICAIGIIYKSTKKYFEGSEELEEVKAIVGNKVLQQEIKAFYTPIRSICKGSFA